MFQEHKSPNILYTVLLSCFFYNFIKYVSGFKSITLVTPFLNVLDLFFQNSASKSVFNQYYSTEPKMFCCIVKLEMHLEFIKMSKS